MAGFSRRYTEDMGPVSVTVLSNDATYLKGRANIIEEIICFKTGRPYLMTIKWTEGAKGRYSYKMQKSEEITESEYQKLLLSHT